MRRSIRVSKHGKDSTKGGCIIGRTEDLTGRRFGKLTVLERDSDYISPSGAHSVKWKCKCDCGVVLAARSSHLKEGRSKSCGWCNGGKLIDIVGQRFGNLVVIEKIDDKRTRYKCECDCGNIVSVNGYNLRHGIANPCSCSQRFQSGENNATYKHGGTGTRLYGIWQGMLNRCRNPKVERYNHYGGKGVVVCDEWKDFSTFRGWAISNGYKDTLSIDRVDANGDYCPSNCRWADDKAQANNKTSNHIIEVNGESHNISEWSAITGINKGTIQSRLRRGWPPERAVSEPVRKGAPNG